MDEQLKLALDAKREGMSLAYGHKTEDWKAGVLSIIRTIAVNKREFTADSVVEVMESKGIENGPALGSAMATAAKLGYIRKTGRVVPGRRKKNHASDLRVWESRLYESHMFII